MRAGQANELQGLGGVSCYIPINFSLKKRGLSGKGNKIEIQTGFLKAFKSHNLRA